VSKAGAKNRIDVDNRSNKHKEQTMRVMMKVILPVEEANRYAKSKKLAGTIQAILAEQKPEAVYFTASCGRRTAYIFLDMKNSSDMARLAEPWFLAFNAAVDIRPVMAPEDLAKAAPDIDAAAKKYA
jgi:hypothetical protein